MHNEKWGVLLGRTDDGQNNDDDGGDDDGAECGDCRRMSGKSSAQPPKYRDSCLCVGATVCVVLVPNSGEYCCCWKEGIPRKGLKKYRLL